MKIQHLFYAGLFFLSSSATLQAAGGPVHEDLTPLYTLTQNMIAQSEQHNTEGFMALAAQALKMTAENLNNSMALTQITGQLRSAKKAVKLEQFNDAIAALKTCQRITQRKRVLGWDGGAE